MIKRSHLYHGAALTQIAEHDSFTAINSHKISDRKSRSSFVINNDCGIFLKYRTSPNKNDEYQFVFTQAQKEEIRSLNDKYGKTFIILICVSGEEICAISVEDFLDLVKRREDEEKVKKEQTQIIARLKQREKFRVFVYQPGKKKTPIGKEIVVSRNQFPKVIFE